MAIQLFIDAWCSFRSAEHVLALFAKLTDVQTPSYGSIRQWVYRLGYYCLKNAPLFNGKWVMILDHTVELGPEKCLVTLGVPLETFESGNYALGHHDVRLLDLDIVTSSTGEQVYDAIEEVAGRYGAPVQIVSDHGSDIKKGVALFCSQKPATIHTYDISHLVAALFKKALKGDEQWDALVKAITQTGKKLNQTDLHFLAPPKQRTKARFMNLGLIINWILRSLYYLKRKDFSEVGAGFCLTQQQATDLRANNATSHLANLPDLAGKFYRTRDEFSEAARTCIGKEAFAKFESLILEQADLGGHKVKQALGWLDDYKESIEIYAEMQQVAQTVMTIIKHKGLGISEFQELGGIMRALPLKSERGQLFMKTVMGTVRDEALKIPFGETLLGCSDVIESLFGKYKHISGRSPGRTMGHLLLALPLMTTSLTADLVKQGMEKIRNLDLKQWADDRLGRSALAKKKEAFKGYRKRCEKPRELLATL